METDKDVVSRFLTYIKTDTQSDPESQTCPSTDKQFVLAGMLKRELENMGVQDVRLDDKCYLYALIPSNCGRKTPSVGFIAHLDTSPDVSGKDVRPVFAEDGCGRRIIKSDGSTLLGADDKAGIAEIMTAVDYILNHADFKHGDVYIAFTPDEEIGRGADFFDLEFFKADFAYTMDGGETGEFSYENFNAAEAEIRITGKNTHPGSAKGIMRNAIEAASALACKINSLLPVPEKTEGREGFVHIHQINGTVEECLLRCLVRDFDKQKFIGKKAALKELSKKTMEEFPGIIIECGINDQYYNMAEITAKYPQVRDIALQAMKNTGIEPVISVTRGGTDGARLSFMGLPCPNIFAGGVNFHSRDEYVPVESMEAATRCIVEIVRITAGLQQ
ncbi:MAG: peptidase T [Bacteroidetes bacterium]|uniref:Peptidase T n=1 Tax=Candidatus Enterocola intestinipullorum TaxID=2840783 RepID=A0A9D9H9Y5_9BACT|nr:peptidase T [Candidatus Enterocola intestinipullorum]